MFMINLSRKILYTALLAFVLPSCTVYTEKQSQAVSQSVYATKDSIDFGRFDLAQGYINETTRIIYPPKNRIDIKPIYDNKQPLPVRTKVSNVFSTIKHNLLKKSDEKTPVKPVSVVDDRGTIHSVVIVPERYKDDKVIVVGSADYNDLLKNKNDAAQLKKDNDNLAKQKTTTDKEIEKQSQMKDKMVNDLNKLQKELVQKNLALLWRNIIIVSLLALIAIYFYAKSNGLFFL